VPSYAGASGGGNSNYKHQRGQTQWGVNKKVTHRQVAPGAVNKMSVAVIVDKSVPKAEVAAVRSAVQNAAGITPQRGDKLSISQVAFAKPPAAPKKAAAASIIGYAKYAGAALALLIFLFFVTRHLRRREAQTLGQPVWLREIESPTSLADLERNMLPDEPTMALGRARPPENPLRGELEELVDREPERVAHQVRAWMNEE
jgi:flagellar M-ring protein FliF